MDPRSATRLFDANARTYDAVNSLVSLGLDSRWRAWAADRAVTSPRARVLDAYCGTGLVGLRAAALGADVTLVDASPAMLAVARSRAAQAGLRARFLLADLEATPSPLPIRSFDAATVVFGVRYMRDPVGQLRRLAGTLASDGRLVVVEFVEPAARSGPASRLAAAYFFGMLPRIAAALSGDPALYEYLVRSTRDIGGPEQLETLVRDAGVTIESGATMGFGLVRGVVARP
ncbi:MAG: class I SAM-dependent methyltransferase [Coriobacteriia bacterium]|nr:class I SAM-dependent methyltransferase [Coriobacteriia bacterium]